MKKLAILAALCAAFPAYADRDGDGDKLFARLTGYEEVPAVSRPGRGEFEARISRDESQIRYGLELQRPAGHRFDGPHPLRAARRQRQHRAVAVPDRRRARLPGSPRSRRNARRRAEVSGTLTAANVVAAGTTSQLILAGELAEVIAAIHRGAAYVNVHALPLTRRRDPRAGARHGGGDDDDHGRGHHEVAMRRSGREIGV